MPTYSGNNHVARLQSGAIPEHGRGKAAAVQYRAWGRACNTGLPAETLRRGRGVTHRQAEDGRRQPQDWGGCLPRI
jgi:hypothetical protein